MLCKACGSYRHLIADCPYSRENQLTARAEYINETAVLFTGTQGRSVSQFGIEAQNSAVLDSACSSTVCGRAWFESYMDSLNTESQKRVIKMEGNIVFRFGRGERLKSIGSYIIPTELAGKKLSLQTDVVDSEIPLLLSKKSMKKAKLTLDTENDRAKILGATVYLNCISGHYCVPISESEITIDTVRAVCAGLEKTQTQYKFGHAPEEKLKALMEDAGNWQSEFEEDLQSACQNCQCNVSKPMSMPLVKFGDTVFFRRDGQDTWMGQAKVMFQHGNTVFVRHGAAYVRVSSSPFQIVKAKWEDLAADKSEGSTETSTSNIGKQKVSSNAVVDDWEQVIVVGPVWNRMEQRTKLCRVIDQKTRREFSIDIDSLTPGTRLIRQ